MFKLDGFERLEGAKLGVPEADMGKPYDQAGYGDRKIAYALDQAHNRDQVDTWESGGGHSVMDYIGIRIDPFSQAGLLQAGSRFDFFVDESQDHVPYFMVGAHTSCGTARSPAKKTLPGAPRAYRRGGNFPETRGGANGIAHESKVGYSCLSQRIRAQLLKDAELLGQGKIKGVVWHFFRSPVTGRLGPSKPLIEFMKKNGIHFIIHR